MSLAPFAEFTARMATDTPPKAVVHAAKRCIIDWFAATCPGGAEPPATLLIQALDDVIGRGRARLFPSGLTTDARTAALINGAASHTIEFDDIFRDAIYHPGVPVVSAAMAVAQAKGLSGLDLIRGVIAGYEVSNRIGRAVNPGHYRYWHTTGTIGTFGAAAATAALLKLDTDGALHAMANAGTLAAGLQQAFRADAMAKPMHGGHAAETGVTCALGAAHGMTGAPDILEGPVGFGAAMCDEPDWTAAADGLGIDYTITRTTVKNHAACGHAHAAIDGLLKLQREHGFAPGEIEHIRVGAYKASVDIVAGKDPATVFEAKFSLPYCAAVALTTGSVRTAAFLPERLADADIRALALKVDVELDDDCEAAFPKQRSAKVEVALADGRKHDIFSPTRKGDPDDPLSDAELEEKYLELLAPLAGDAAARDLLATLWRLDDVSDAGDLVLVAEALGNAAQ